MVGTPIHGQWKVSVLVVHQGGVLITINTVHRKDQFVCFVSIALPMCELQIGDIGRVSASVDGDDVIYAGRKGMGVF